MKKRDKHIRLLGASGLSLLVILVSLVISEWLRSDSERLVIRSSEVKFTIVETFRILQNIETSQRGYLLTGEEWYLQPVQQQEQKIAFNIAVVKEKIGNSPTQEEFVDEFSQLSLAKLEEMRATIELLKQGRNQEAIEKVKTHEGELLMNKIEALTNNLIGEENRILQERKSYNGFINTIFYGLLVLAFSVAAFSLIRLFGKVSPLVNKLETVNEQLQLSLQAKDNEIARRKAILKVNQRLIRGLQAKNLELDHFAYVASHDLKEPLRTVDNFIDVFKEDYEEKLGQDAYRYFGFMKEATARMRNLIEGLLQYSRIGKSGNFVEISLSELVLEVEKNLAATISEKEATIVYGTLPRLNCLKIEMTQLLQNLLANALKFMAPGAKPLVEINARDMEDHWQFCVRDNGIGISETNQLKIFDMFTRLHGENKFDGQGIGLAFCRKIVELHKGRIWVESALNKGSCFYFTIQKNLSNEEEIEQDIAG